jgi:CRP-like cAMP-binding protein
MSVGTAWVRRLSGFTALTLEDKQVLSELSASARLWASQEALAKIGDSSDRLFVVLSGLACRFKLLPDGRRQILSLMLPGDMCDPRHLLLTRLDHSISALVPSGIATLTLGSLQRIERNANLDMATNRYALSQQSISREWLVNVGHRTAFERVGHLICEIYTRLESVGLTHAHTFDLPLTQAEIGDTLALSSVHVNRTLMELRRLKLVTFQNRTVSIHDFATLTAATGFDSGYLLASVDVAAVALAVSL